MRGSAGIWQRQSLARSPTLTPIQRAGPRRALEVSLSRALNGRHKADYKLQRIPEGAKSDAGASEPREPPDPGHRMGRAGKGADHTNPRLTRQRPAGLGNGGSLAAPFSSPDPAGPAAAPTAAWVGLLPQQRQGGEEARGRLYSTWCSPPPPPLRPSNFSRPLAGAGHPPPPRAQLGDPTAEARRELRIRGPPPPTILESSSRARLPGGCGSAYIIFPRTFSARCSSVFGLRGTSVAEIFLFRKKTEEGRKEGDCRETL